MKYCSGLLKSLYWELDIDLVSDLNKIMYDYLIKSGYKNVDLERALYQYFNLKKRTIKRQSRNIHKSKEFSCPKGYEKALAEFELRIENGDNLNLFLSDKLKEANYNDGLLNDWNIYHFHLTKQFRDDGWAKRSEFLLFAYITEADVYMLQIYKHKEKYLFSKSELVEIIYNNWPELIEKNHIKDIKPSISISDKEYSELRKANISTLVNLKNEKAFGFIGGGYMSDGSSTEAVSAADYWHNLLKNIEGIIIENMELLSNLIIKETGNKTSSFRLQLLWVENDTEFTLYEHNNKVIVQVNLEKSQFRICDPLFVFGRERSYYNIKNMILK